MTSPLWSTGRPLVTWHGTSSSAGTSQRYMGGLTRFSPCKERQVWKRRLEGGEKGLWRPQLCHSSALGAWLSGHQSLWEKKTSLNFYTPHNSERRGIDASTVKANRVNTFNTAMFGVKHLAWADTHLEGNCREMGACLDERAPTFRPARLGLALASLGWASER